MVTPLHDPVQRAELSHRTDMQGCPKRPVRRVIWSRPEHDNWMHADACTDGICSPTSAVIAMEWLMWLGLIGLFRADNATMQP